MHPIGKYIIIITVEEELKTASGLLLSQNDAKDLRYHKGIVVAVGTDVQHIKSEDTIYYDKRAGYTMLIDENQYTVISERDVVVVL